MTKVRGQGGGDRREAARARNGGGAGREGRKRKGCGRGRLGSATGRLWLAASRLRVWVSVEVCVSEAFACRHTHTPHSKEVWVGGWRGFFLDSPWSPRMGAEDRGVGLRLDNGGTKVTRTRGGGGRGAGLAVGELPSPAIKETSSAGPQKYRRARFCAELAWSLRKKLGIFVVLR